MILNIPENRMLITEYLETISEDNFINEIIIPFFSSQGYYLYTINEHGPGEHGKDLIFYRHIPIFYDNEYIAIQAKTEKANTSNVVQFYNQIKRALGVPFPSKSGGYDIYPDYALFMNARSHSNEGGYEFQKMVSKERHIKILSQENVIELIMSTGIGPKHLIDQLSSSDVSEFSSEDKLVFDTIIQGNPAEIDNLLDNKVKLIRDYLGPRVKELVIDYAYDRWQMDRSWKGTVKPMKWFDIYFDFFTEKQSKYLLSVFEELILLSAQNKIGFSLFLIIIIFCI